MNCRLNQECCSGQLQYAWNTGSIEQQGTTPASLDGAGWGCKAAWNSAQSWPCFAQPTPFPAQDAPTQVPDTWAHRKVTWASHSKSLNTPPNSWVAPLSTPPPPPPPPGLLPQDSSSLPSSFSPPSSSSTLSSPFAILQQVLDTAAVSRPRCEVSDLPTTRGSRVLTAEDVVTVSGPACLHTSPAVAVPSAPSPSRSALGIDCTEGPRAGNMPCIQEETCVMADTFVDVDQRRNIVDSWPVRDASKPVVVFPTNVNLSTQVDMYIDVVTQTSDAESFSAGKTSKITEAISKKNYFLRREDKDADVAPSQTTLTGHISRTEVDDEDNRLTNGEPMNLVESGRKTVKRSYRDCNGKLDGTKRGDSPKRKKSMRTPPPITRTPHPTAPMIPGTTPDPARQALPSTLRAIPLQVQPLDPRPLSPIAHLKTPDPAPNPVPTSHRLMASSIVPLTGQRLFYSGALADSAVTDVPIRPVPITGSLRPCLSSTHPRYLPLPPLHRFPPRPILPIPLPPLAAFAGAPLTFFHPGIPVLSASATHALAPLTNLPHHGELSAVALPLFKRPQLFPRIAPGSTADSSTLLQRYGAPIAPPRRHARRRRRSSGDSQPAEDGPEEHVARRKQANARERDRVNHLNSGFDHLKQVLPWMHHGRRVSKVDTLRAAIDYINHLQRILWEADAASFLSGARTVGQSLSTTDMCKFVHHHHYARYGLLPTSFAFSDNTSRTAVETCRPLELGPPQTKIPRLGAPLPLPPHETNPLHWIHGFGGVRVPFANGPISGISSHTATCTDVTTKVNDVNNNSNAAGRIL